MKEQSLTVQRSKNLPHDFNKFYLMKRFSSLCCTLQGYCRDKDVHHNKDLTALEKEEMVTSELTASRMPLHILPRLLPLFIRLSNLHDFSLALCFLATLPLLKGYVDCKQ